VTGATPLAWAWPSAKNGLVGKASKRLKVIDVPREQLTQN
jgi:hypothetical protein